MASAGALLNKSGADSICCLSRLVFWGISAEADSHCLQIYRLRIVYRLRIPVDCRNRTNMITGTMYRIMTA